MRAFFGLLLFALSAALPARAQTDAAAIYQYKGPDREAKLVEGAKKEGTLLLYTSMAPTESNQLAQAFEKKYGIKVQVWRNLSETVLQRTIAEARARRHSVDVIETNGPEVEVLAQEGLISEFYSPHIAALHPYAVPPHKKYVSDRVNPVCGRLQHPEDQARGHPRDLRGLRRSEMEGQACDRIHRSGVGSAPS